MIGLVLVSHGKLADELHKALVHVVGPQQQIEVIGIEPEDDGDQRRRDILASIRNVDTGDGVIVVTDMFGGTPSNLAISAMDDGDIEVLAGAAHPLGIVTKSALVERDIDLLAPMAARGLVSVCVSVTTLDHGLARRMEPRATAPARRLRTIRTLSEAGIPVTVLVAPIIPVINDAEIERIVETVAEAGARGAGYVLLRLPLEINRLFQDWLQTHYPLKAGHVMARVRDMRGGREYESGFGTRMRGRGLFADLIATRFAGALRRAGLDGERPVLDTSQFRPPSPRAATGETQLDLF